MFRWTGALVRLALAVGLALAVVLAASVYVLTSDEPSPTLHRPVAMRFLGEGGDPLVIMIGIEWAASGWCSGQFTVAATETPTEVHVADVVNRMPKPSNNCAGLGSDGRMAWVPLTLSAPLATRTAVRATDGHILPLVQFGP